MSCPCFQARHGTREPTRKRIAQLNGFADRLRNIFNAIASQAGCATNVAADVAATCPSLAPYAWMAAFQSPWEGHKGGGELLPVGEEELYHMGRRYRERFASIFGPPYHSKAVRFLSTQVRYVDLPRRMNRDDR